MVIAIDNTPVEIKITGEELAPIIWRGKQWAVTEFGVERLNGTYSLTSHQLCDTDVGSDYPSLPSHMAQKTWVDIHEFCTAFMIALAIYPDMHDFTPQQIREGVEMSVYVRGQGDGA